MPDPATYDLSTPLRQVLTIPLNQRGALKRAGYTTLGELVGLSVSQLKRIKGIGDTTAKQIREIVAEAKYATAESDYAQLDDEARRIQDENMRDSMAPELDRPVDLGESVWEAMDGSEPTEETKMPEAQVPVRQPHGVIGSLSESDESALMDEDKFDKLHGVASASAAVTRSLAAEQVGLKGDEPIPPEYLLQELEEMRERALGETSRLTAPLIGEDAAADAMIEEEEQDVAAAAETPIENRPTELELAEVSRKLHGLDSPGLRQFLGEVRGLGRGEPDPAAIQAIVNLPDDDPVLAAAVDRLAALPPAPRQQRHEIPWDADTIRKILVLDRRWPAPGLEKKARMVLVFLQQGEELDDAAEKAGFAPSEDSVAAVVGTVRALFERVALMCVNRALPR